jgi:S-adenosylmethionine:diacylglycerol 3-amino-3-carboxypropyl transferase
MRYLFEYGISQEDPQTEFQLLDTKPGDHVLCVASGGEIPLSLLCLQPGSRITAVDISGAQLLLARLKLCAAIQLPPPANGEFLGFVRAEKKWRREVYFDLIDRQLDQGDREFWRQHLDAIEAGIINRGRFELFISKLRPLLRSIIGKSTIRQLLAAGSLAKQEEIFDNYIATRRRVRYLFRLAFHPIFYRNRGINPAGLKHATHDAGKIFFGKFRNFCTATPAVENYFLQYFLDGNCTTTAGLPIYLQDGYRQVLSNHRERIEWKIRSIEDEIDVCPMGTFNKIHLSNIGDWMTTPDFAKLIDTLFKKTKEGEILSYRFLHKNHFSLNESTGNGFKVSDFPMESLDRFPFYHVLLVQRNGQLQASYLD